MSAAVLGKRSLLEDIYSPPPLSKRGRCSPPPRFSPPARPLPVPFCEPPSSEALAALRQLFPSMDESLLLNALNASGNDINLAIRSLNGLHLNSNDGNQASSSAAAVVQGDKGEPSQKPSDASSSRDADREGVEQENNGRRDPATMAAEDWVELVVNEMMTSADLDNARSRAARVLEAFEKAVQQRGTEASQAESKELLALRSQIVKMSQENSILKRAVTTYHSRQQESEGKNRELEQLKQLLSQYQEQLRSLEVTNYALNLHLKTAQQASTMPNRFHPDIF